MAKEAVVEEKKVSNESPWSAYAKSMTKFNMFITPTAKILSANLASLTGQPTGVSNWDWMSVAEKQPFLDLAEKIMVSLKVQMPKHPVAPKP